MKSLYIGIDPGLDGAICIISPDTVEAFVVPTISQGSGTSKRLYDIPAMVDILLSYRGKVVLVALERGRAMRGQGVTSMFRFGHGCGLWEGALAALRIPYKMVQPREWQKVVCAGLAGDPKARAVQAVSTMLPELELRKSSRATKPHQGICDAAALALYSRIFSQGK